MQQRNKESRRKALARAWTRVRDQGQGKGVERNSVQEPEPEDQPEPEPKAESQGRSEETTSLSAWPQWKGTARQPLSFLQIRMPGIPVDGFANPIHHSLHTSRCDKGRAPVATHVLMSPAVCSAVSCIAADMRVFVTQCALPTPTYTMQAVCRAAQAISFA